MMGQIFAVSTISMLVMFLSALLSAADESNAVTSATVYPVSSPPPALMLDPFYTKYVDASGFPVVASAEVNDFALKEAAYLIDLMLAKRPDVKKAMVASGSRLVVIGYRQFTTDIPEYAQMKPRDFWDVRARGLGGSETDPVCSCGEENLLGFAGDPYHAENILIHELAHNIHLRGVVRLDPTFDDRLKQTYDKAMREGLWKTKYASVNHHEYLAEGVQSWFNNNRPPDHDHNHVDTREELREYDPGLAAICDEVFGDTEVRYSRPETRLVGHLAGYVPAEAPKFVWPERLQQARKEMGANALKGQRDPPQETAEPKSPADCSDDVKRFFSWTSPLCGSSPVFTGIVVHRKWGCGDRQRV
jgi:hypothetical protein